MLHNQQKGQSMVEFAIVVPFFVLFVMAIAYFGAAISDYIAINNMARSCAREASIGGRDTYTKLEELYLNKPLTAGLYEWGEKAKDAGLADISVTEDLSESTPGDHGNVVVKMHSSVNPDGNSAAAIFVRLLRMWSGSAPHIIDIDVTYTMYSEFDLSKSNS